MNSRRALGTIAPGPTRRVAVMFQISHEYGLLHYFDYCPGDNGCEIGVPHLVSVLSRVGRVKPVVLNEKDAMICLP